MKNKCRVIVAIGLAFLLGGCAADTSHPASSVVVPGATDLLCRFSLTSSMIRRGQTGEFRLAISSTSTSDVAIPAGVLESFSVKVRETGASWAEVAWGGTNTFPGGVLPSHHSECFDHRIFTSRKDQMPDGPNGPIGVGVVVDASGQYHLDLQYAGLTVATQEFTIR